MKQIAVIGGGSWATAIVKMLCNNAGQVHPDGRMSYGVNWWVRNKETADYIKKYNHNDFTQNEMNCILLHGGWSKSDAFILLISVTFLYSISITKAYESVSCSTQRRNSEKY